jgi:hypothetical protein
MIKDTVQTSHITGGFSIKRAYQLTSFGQIIAVCSEKHAKHKNTTSKKKNV